MPLTLPAGAYPGLDRDLERVGKRSPTLARPNLPDDIAYRFARALHNAQPALAERLAQARESIPASTLAAVPDRRQLHLGALR